MIALRDSRVATEDNVEELWALKERAHAIYGETVEAAGRAGMTDEEYLDNAKSKARGTVETKIGLLSKWIDGHDDTRAREIVASGIDQLNALYPKVDAAETADAAYALKDDAYSIYRSTIEAAEAAVEGIDTRTKSERAAEELKNARWSTLSLIERKTAILATAAEAARNPSVSATFAGAADEIADLQVAARSAESVGALKEIDSRVVDIYHAARDAVAELRGESGAEDHAKDPARRLEAHLVKIADHVDYLTALASGTAQDSPDTYPAVVAANEEVHKAIAAVVDVAESGKNLDTRWEDLARSLRIFKHAFVAHIVALADGPICIGRLHIPG